MLVVCYYLVASFEGRPTSVRAVSAQTGVSTKCVSVTLSRFRRDILVAQREESTMGTPITAWIRRGSCAAKDGDAEADGA